MGKIKQGILGGFRGKVGTVIGASWNGIAYMKGIHNLRKTLRLPLRWRIAPSSRKSRISSAN